VRAVSEYRLRSRALEDMQEIWIYTRKRWSEDQADSYWRQIKIALEAVAERPSRGQSAAALRPGYMKYKMGSHIVFFVKTEFGIDVVRILHERMDMPSRLEESANDDD
jgi:toxin ParE1/3/4